MPEGRGTPNRRGVLSVETDAGWAFAAYDVDSRHVEPGVRATRLAAHLAPYRTRQAAEIALADAGAVEAIEERR